jgi:hypothetical protein
LLDDVGGLPQRGGYPVPQSQMAELVHELGEQFAQGRQVEHSGLAITVQYASRLRGAGRLAGLIGEAADRGSGQAFADVPAA